MKVYSHSSNSSLCSRSSIASTTIEQLLQFEAEEHDRSLQQLILEGEAATATLESQLEQSLYFPSADNSTLFTTASTLYHSLITDTTSSEKPIEEIASTPEQSIEEIEIRRIQNTTDNSMSSSIDVCDSPPVFLFPQMEVDPSIDPMRTMIPTTPNSTYCSDTFIEDPNIIETAGATRAIVRNNKRSLSDLFSPEGCSKTTHSPVSTINTISDNATDPPGPPGPSGHSTVNQEPKRSIIYKKYLKSQCCKAAQLFPILTHDSAEVIAREIENYHSSTSSLTRDECTPPFSTYHVDESIFWRVATPDRHLQNSTITMPPSASFCHMMTSTVFDNNGKEYKRYIHTLGLDIDSDGKVFHDSYAPHNHKSMLVIRQPEPDEHGGIVDPITNETLYTNFLDQYRITYKNNYRKYEGTQAVVVNQLI